MAAAVKRVSEATIALFPWMQRRVAVTKPCAGLSTRPWMAWLERGQKFPAADLQKFVADRRTAQAGLARRK